MVFSINSNRVDTFTSLEKPFIVQNGHKQNHDERLD